MKGRTYDNLKVDVGTIEEKKDQDWWGTTRVTHPTNQLEIWWDPV